MFMKHYKKSLPVWEQKAEKGENTYPSVIRDAINKKLNGIIAMQAFNRKVKKPICVWQGESLFDGSPISVVISQYASDSANRKTGAMVQVSVLPTDKNAHEAFKSGSPSVCGDCKYNGSGCYVRWFMVERQRKSVQYLKNSAAALLLGQRLLRAMRVRVGTAGDPAAVPTHVWRTLLQDAEGWTGYTHAWKTCDQELKGLFLASCDNEQEVIEAGHLGWSCYYVYDTFDIIHPEVIQCLYQEKMTTCYDCMLCHGRAKKQIVVGARLHGATNTKSQARSARKAAKNRSGEV